MNFTVISPHTDDAVFSVCEHMLTWLEQGHRVKVVTVFGGMPDDPAGRVKHGRLNNEHAEAMDAVGCRHVALDFLDDVYEPRPSRQAIKDALAPHLADADVIVAPVGIHHPDHLVVSSLVADHAFVLGEPDVWWYEELPYRVIWPAGDDREGWPYHRQVGHGGWLQRKKEICRLYASQVDEEVERCLYAPERVWRPK